MQPISTNKQLITIVYKGLKHLQNEVVFVGGAVTELYVPSTADVAEVRSTDDVDCVIQISNYTAYTNIENELRKLGFENDLQLINRWWYNGIQVDIMPADAKILGFTNVWYQKGFEHIIQVTISANTTIHIYSFPYFLASKLTALFDRGINDLRLSKDFEDIVFCLFYLEKIKEEVLTASNNVKVFIASSMKQLLSNKNLDEAIFSVLPSGEVFEANIQLIKSSIADLAKL